MPIQAVSGFRTVGMSRYEQPRFAVTSRGRGYEIRRYEPHHVAETTVEGSFESTGNVAFRRLAGLIFGRNSANLRMNMTVPVTQQPSGAGRHRYRFMMEQSYTEDTLPAPVDESVRLVAVSAGYVAVREFRGGRSERRFRGAESTLTQALARDGIEVTGPAQLAVYSGPLTPPFLKRNEVLVPVAAG